VNEVEQSFELANILLDHKNTVIANELNRYKKFRVEKETEQLYGSKLQIKTKAKLSQNQTKLNKEMEREKSRKNKLEMGIELTEEDWEDREVIEKRKAEKLVQEENLRRSTELVF